MVVPDAIPPIIPLELFEDVQEKIAKNKKAPARHKAEESYLLTTKLYCGKCGALMFTYYKCAAAKKKKTCDKKAVRKQWLEDLVVNQTMQLVKDDAAMESIIAKVMELQNKENTNIPLYEKQLRIRYPEYAQCDSGRYPDQFHQGAAGAAGRNQA